MPTILGQNLVVRNIGSQETHHQQWLTTNYVHSMAAAPRSEEYGTRLSSGHPIGVHGELRAPGMNDQDLLGIRMVVRRLNGARGPVQQHHSLPWARGDLLAPVARSVTSSDRCNRVAIPIVGISGIDVGYRCILLKSASWHPM